MGMFTLPHHIFYKKGDIEAYPYILGGLVEDYSLFFGRATSLLTGRHTQGSTVGDGRGCDVRIHGGQVLGKERVLVELGNTNINRGKLTKIIKGGCLDRESRYLGSLFYF